VLALPWGERGQVAGGVGGVSYTTDGLCVLSGKVRFPSDADASARLIEITEATGRLRGGYYHCSHCAGWHITQGRRRP
jgi:hypothetical protein